MTGVLDKDLPLARDTFKAVCSVNPSLLVV